MKKYKNIVFDMGNVLLDFSPHTIVLKFTTDQKHIHTLVHEIFLKQEWLDLDQGIMDEEEAYISITQRLDQKYYPIVKNILNHWHESLVERDEMINLLELLKLKGYKLYLFSNASKRFYTYYKNFKCLTYFDKMIISADIKHSKPSKEFYSIASNLCQIELQDSFFIDDSAQNILNAYRIGMDGYIHNGSYQLLYQYLQNLNIID